MVSLVPLRGAFLLRQEYVAVTAGIPKVLAYTAMKFSCVGAAARHARETGEGNAMRPGLGGKRG